jgi:hypothetical protein
MPDLANAGPRPAMAIYKWDVLIHLARGAGLSVASGFKQFAKDPPSISIPTNLMRIQMLLHFLCTKHFNRCPLIATSTKHTKIFKRILPAERPRFDMINL